MHAYVILKKVQKIAMRLIYSFVFAFMLYLGVVTLEAPIAEVLEHNPKELTLDNSYTGSDESFVLGKSTEKVQVDATTYNYRARVFDLYFRENDSPLEGQGQTFIEACKQYGAPSDCTLLPAIARVETDFCKTDISASQFNCWGYGGSGENRIIYSSFEESIDNITKRLMDGYGEGFFNNPEIGELYYCGRHCNRWGDHVIVAQNDLKNYARSLGYEL